MYVDALHLPLAFSPVDDMVGAGAIHGTAHEGDMLPEIGMGGLAAFDFHQIHRGTVGDHQIRLQAVVVAEKMESPPAGPMLFPFERIGDKQVFEQGSTQGMRSHMAGNAIAEKPGSQTHIPEIQFRGFYQTFTDILMPWLQKKHDETCLQYGNPVLGG